MIDNLTMASFKTWLEKNMGSAGIDQTPTNTAVQTNAMVGDFFTNSPEGADMLGNLTGIGNNTSQLRIQVPDIAGQVVKFAGQDAKRAQVTPMDVFPQIGREVFGKQQLPTFFRGLAQMLKKMKK